jgi:cytochrome c-type biogenesis protein CcmH/NrfF
MEGFNRLAWIMPFATLFIAGTILTVVIRRRQATTDAAPPLPARPAGDEALRARLERELDDLDRDT